MISWNERRPGFSYEVTLGHQTVTVHAASADEAVEEARRRLSLDFPRLWDVIHTVDRARFVVRSASS